MWGRRRVQELSLRVLAWTTGWEMGHYLKWGGLGEEQRGETDKSSVWNRY